MSDKASLPDAAVLLAESVDAIGGTDRILAIRSYYSEAEITVDAGKSGIGKTWWQDGNSYTEICLPSGRGRTGILNGAVWTEDPVGGLRDVTGIEAEQLIWSERPCLAHGWRQHFISATTTAIEGSLGLAEIVLVSHLGDNVTVRIDTDTKMMASISGRAHGPVDAVVTTTFSDYREVAGVRFPFLHECTTEHGRLVTAVTRFDVNVDIDASKFAKPPPRRASVLALMMLPMAMAMLARGGRGAPGGAMN